MKIERPRHLQKLLERSLRTGDVGPLKAALEQTPPAEAQAFLSSVDAHKRKDIEKLLAQHGGHSLEVTVPGRRIHDVRAHRRPPWWGGVEADPLPAPIHPEPAKDVDVYGERFTRDDVRSLLRSMLR